MRRLPPLFPPLVALACVASMPALPANGLTSAEVSFAPKYESLFEREYGAREVPVLRSDIVRSVSQSLQAAGDRCGLRLQVTVERAVPTHPTMAQQMRDPSLSPLRTVYRDGGASLTGHVLDASGRVLTTVKYQNFSGYSPDFSAATDPWSEARVAISQFSDRLVTACVEHSTTPSPRSPPSP